MVELAVSMCVLVVLTAIAVPSLMHSLRAYQLNDAAGRLSDMLKFTRFEAVRRNTQVNFLIRASGSNWIAGTDSNNNGAIDPTEKQILIGGFATLLASANAPSSGSILLTLGGVNSLTTLSGVATITFDARGAVTPLVAYVFYLGNPNGPDFGYRAVVLLPSGATQIWTAPLGGPWKRTG